MTKQEKELRVLKRSEHGGRTDLVGEHPFGDAGQLILLALFLLIWGLDSFVFKFSTFLSPRFPDYIQIPLMIILFLFSGYLAKTGLWVVFKEVRNPPEVITEGVFGRVRHPIYLGALLLYLGMIVATLSLLSLLFWIVIFFFYNYIAGYEEKLLEAQFGEAFRRYKERVPRWLPLPEKNRKS